MVPTPGTPPLMSSAPRREPRCVAVADAARAGEFYVDCFTLCAVRLSATLPGELAILHEMLGTPIDPDVLACARDVGEALGVIAINASNVICARLSAVNAGGAAPNLASTTLVAVSRPTARPQDYTGGPAVVGAVPEPPVTFASLPGTLIARILCHCGAPAAALALARTCRALRAAVASELRHAALPTWHVARDELPCCVVVGARPSGSVDPPPVRLTRGPRHGHALFGIGDALGGASALLEVEIDSLAGAGGARAIDTADE